jgi:kumamolisin
MAFLFAQQTPSSEVPPYRPPSDELTAGIEKRAASTYVLTPAQLALPAQLSEPINQITAPPERPQEFRPVSIASDLDSASMDERIARFAMAQGVARPAPLRGRTTYRLLAIRNAPSIVPIPQAIGESPGAIRSLYGITGNGSGVIAIVDPYKYPTAEQDLQKFSSYYNLPPCTQGNGCLDIEPMSPTIVPDTDPSVSDCGWSGEAALDLEWAHAIAPGAKLIFVEAVSSNLDNLFAAVDKATTLVLRAGGGQVSLSWAIKERLLEASDEADYDSHFVDGVIYFASSGDVGAVTTYPASSPKVIAVGGTAIVRDSQGKFITEEGWSGTGGGNSRYEPRPAFQNNVENIVGTTRATPDISASADLNPSTGHGSPIWAGTVCSGNTPGWYLAGGTSLATPIVAAATNVAGKKRSSTLAEQSAIYSNRKTPLRVKDITISDSVGPNVAAKYWDYVTGIGVVNGLNFDAP